MKNIHVRNRKAYIRFVKNNRLNCRRYPNVGEAFKYIDERLGKDPNVHSITVSIDISFDKVQVRA